MGSGEKGEVGNAHNLHPCGRTVAKCHVARDINPVCALSM